MNLKDVGAGKVMLIAGGGKIYTDVAARITRSEKSLEDIVGAPYDKHLVQTILDSGHKAAIEFDYFLFGVEGYSRVTEIQLVRKRLASYMIKSGRVNKKGRRSFDVVVPKDIMDFSTSVKFPADKIMLLDGKNVKEKCCTDYVQISLNAEDLLNMTEDWYNGGVNLGKKEEELRYLKPQATEFKALIGMNAHALRDWFAIRCCMNAQTEIRDMANKMLTLCKEAAPDLFKGAGPNCKILGYCPENKRQNKACRGKVPTKDEALEILKSYKPKE